jgi:hypothetical protein
LDTPAIIRISQPADLVGVLPHLLGFHPTDSLVIVVQRGRRMLVAARIDLPAEPGDATYQTTLDRLAANMAGRGATAAALVGYGTPDLVSTAVQLSTAALTAAGIEVLDALRVHDGRFYALLCTDPDCCPPEGTPFDPTTTVAAASATYAGLTALPNRDSLAAQLAPTTGPARDAFADATALAVTTVLDALQGATRSNEDLLDLAATAWAEAANCYRAGGVLDDAQAAMFTVLLDLPPVAGDTARRTTGEDWQIRMWTDLVRRAEPPFVAEAANMLALSAMQAGSGALATLAIARALQADPSNRLATSLATINASGPSPSEVSAILHD